MASLKLAILFPPALESGIHSLLSYFLVLSTNLLESAD